MRAPDGRTALDVLRAFLADRTIPVIVADNVAEFLEHRGSLPKEWPCLAPAWDSVFIEYRHRGARFGAWLWASDFAKGGTLEEIDAADRLWGAGIIRSTRERYPGRTIRWLLNAQLFRDEGREILGPVGMVAWVLDEHGSRLNAIAVNGDGGSDDPMSELAPVLQTLAFAHCRNAVLDRHSAPPKLARAYQRRSGHEPVRWLTVRLELPRPDRPHGDPSRVDASPGLHIVAGHFAHYGDCCPTQHEPKGKLFGRLEGLYWMPQHLRGDPAREVRSDRVVVLRPEGQPPTS